MSSGLSSSSALVVATTLSLSYLWTNGESLPSMKVVIDCCIEAERLIGTMGGGMDQTVSCLGKQGKALHISTYPHMLIEEVKLPENTVLVLANSLVSSEKAAGSRLSYNTRVIECQLSAIVLVAMMGCGASEMQGIKTLRHAEEVFINLQDSKESPISGTIASLSCMTALVDQYLTHHDYSLGQIDEIINGHDDTSAPRFSILSCLDSTKRAVQDVINNVRSFKLNQRAKHVYEEAKRVLLFKEKCTSLERLNVGKEGVEQELGTLMNESHNSLRNLYECSCGELDTLQQICSTAPGCLGSRLTGAGWGGMVVSLVQKHQVTAFIERIKIMSFDEKGYHGDIDDVLFVSSPCAGASVTTSM